MWLWEGRGSKEMKKKKRGRVRIAIRVTGFLTCKLIRGQAEEIEINGCIHPSGHISLVKILSILNITPIFLNTVK